MLTCFIFAKSAPKLRRFNDDQAKSWHASKLHSFKPKLNFLHISINDTVWSKVLKPKNKDTRTTQGSHHSHEPKPFILGGGGVEGSRQPRRRRLDPLASIARVNLNRLNLNPTNPSALVNPGSLDDCGFLGFVVLSHYAVFLLFMFLVSNFFTWVGFIFILLYCFGIDIGHCSLGHWIFFRFVVPYYWEKQLGFIWFYHRRGCLEPPPPLGFTRATAAATRVHNL